MLQAKIPRDLIRRVQHVAVSRGVHPRDVVMEALEKYLPKQEARQT